MNMRELAHAINPLSAVRRFVLRNVRMELRERDKAAEIAAEEEARRWEKARHECNASVIEAIRSMEAQKGSAHI